MSDYPIIVLTQPQTFTTLRNTHLRNTFGVITFKEKPRPPTAPAAGINLKHTSDKLGHDIAFVLLVDASLSYLIMGADILD